MSLNDASLFIQSSSIAGWEKSRFLPFPYRNCTLGRLRHFSTTRNVRKDKEEGIILTWKKKKKKSCVERNERAAIHLILFAEGGGGDAPCDASSKQSGQKDFFGLQGEQRTPLSYSF
jgi:hypothetical protein